MSDGDSKAERTRTKAVEAAFEVHREGRRLLERWGKDDSAPSLATTLEHLVVVCEAGLADFQVVAAAGALSHPRRRTLRQAVAWRTLRATWIWPGEGCAALRSAPRRTAQGSLVDRLTTWAARSVSFLRENPPEFLGNVRLAHPLFGELTPVDWLALLRIHLRHHELELEVEMS